MEIQDFWNTYTDNLTPAELVWQFGKGDPAAGVRAFMEHCPGMYGILCRHTWRETFASKEQYNRERIGSALITYLEMNRDEWESQVKELARTETEAKMAERKRAEAEALAAAVARVEAEAREKAAKEESKAQEQTEPEQQAVPTPAPKERTESHPVHNNGLSQARTSSDAEAIAAAMARVEAEARAKAAVESQAREQETAASPDTQPQCASPPESDGASNS